MSASLSAMAGQNSSMRSRASACALEGVRSVGDEPRGPACKRTRTFGLFSLRDGSAGRVRRFAPFAGAYQLVGCLCVGVVGGVVGVGVDHADPVGELEDFVEELIERVRVE